MNIDPEKAKFTKEFQTVFEKQRDRMASYEVLREKVLMEEETVYGLFANLFNAFCIAGGLQAVDSIVTAEKLNLKAAAAGLVGYKLPLDVIAMVLAPFKSIKAIAKDEVCKEVATVGKTAFFQRVQVLDDKEIKDINKEQIAGAMSLMRGFLKLIHNEEEASKMIQAHEMLISLKFLQSASLEKRLNGLADIKRMIDRVDQLIDRPIPGQDTTGWFNADYLVKWIVQHNILGKILDDNAHAELIRRTSYILTFLARHGAITTEMLELLWKCQQDKHEDLVRAVYDTVKDIVEFLSPENIRFINAKLMAYPLEAYDEKLISFTKDFTLKAYASQSKAEEASLRKKSDDKKAGEPAQVVSEPPPEVTGKIERGPAGEVLVTAAESMYGLPRLWALQQDESPAQQPLIGMATTAFKEIIVSNNSARYRYQYLYLCMENLKNNKSVPQSLALANYIIAIVNAHKLLHKTTVVELITRLAKEYGLVDVVLGSFQHYEKLVVEALGKGLRQENVGEAVIVGKYKHVSNLELRFKFTEHLRRFGEDAAKFGTENVMKLWRLFVDDCSSEFDTQQFLKWLASEKEGNGCMVPLGVFSQDENQILFDTLAKSRVRLGNSPNLSYYRCFSTLFKLLNINSKSGEVRKGRFRTLKFATLSGLDELWENACRCGQEASRAQFCELLIDAYTNLHESVAGQRKDTMAALVDRCMGCVIKAEADKDELTITNIVKLLQQLFDIIDGKRYEDTEETTAHKFQISLVLKPGSYFVWWNNLIGLETKAAEVGMDVVVGQLRRKAAEAFHLPFSGIQLFTSTRTFDPEEDDQKLRVLGWVQQIYVQKLAGETGNEDPKMYLAQKQEYILSLFSLLSKETSPYVDSVWSLLTTLPANKKMQTDIETLSLPEGVSVSTSLRDC